MRGNGIQALPWCVRGFMICLRVQALPSRLHRIMQKAFASVVSFHFRFVYKVTLLRASQKALPLKFSGAGIGLKSVVYHMKLQALPSAGMPFPSIAPRLDFVLRALTASLLHFLSENDVRYALVKENGL